MVAAALVLPVSDLVRHGSFRRLALRNIGRRKGEALLIVAGCLMGTAIITASFVVGDTFNSSIRDTARTQLGPIDERVSVSDRTEARSTEAFLRTSHLTDVDGVLAVEWTDVAVASVGRERRAEPSERLVEYDFAAAREFGQDASSTGFARAGPTPSGSDAVINADLARQARHPRGRSTGRVRIRRPVATASPPGRTPTRPCRIGRDLRRARHDRSAGGGDHRHRGRTTARRGVGVQPWRSILCASSTVSVDRQLTERLQSQAVRIETTKHDVLADARARGDSIGQLFTGIGMFSVLAGVLLLVNLFVMLAEERKTELGMLRAVGLRRNHLMRAFGLEGACYGVVAAILGAVAGVGVGAAIVVVTRGIFTGDASGNVTLRFAAARRAS